MTKAFDAIYEVILTGDLEDSQAAIKEHWGCLQPGEWPLVKILMSSLGGGGGGVVDSSEGGFDADDAGKIPEFAADGGLITTNGITIFEGVGRTNYWRIDTAGVSGERDVSVVDSSGQLPLWVVGIPVDSAASGKAGMMAYDTDALYICIAADTWRRVDLTTF